MQPPHRESVLKSPDRNGNGNGNGTAESMMQQQQPSPSLSPSIDAQTPQTTATTPDEPHPPPPDTTPEDMPPAEPAIMHFPHCRLEITALHGLPASFAAAPCKLEQVALPGALVRTLLSRFEGDMQQKTASTTQTHHVPASQQQQSSLQLQQLSQLQETSQHQPPPPPPPPAAVKQQQKRKRERRVRIHPHPDDAHDWVFSRCLLADFTSLRDDEAEALSAQGRLCCWASVVLRPVAEFYDGGEGLGEDGYEYGDGRVELGDGAHDGHEGGRRYEDEQVEEVQEDEEWWELGFVVHGVGVRDPRGGWCGCF